MPGVDFQLGGSGISQATADARYTLVTSDVVAVVSTQFDKTNNTLANIPGLSITVGAGETWVFRADLYVNSSAIGGSKYGVGGTATSTSFKARVTILTDGVSTSTNTSPGVFSATEAQGFGADTNVTITGTITVNAAGTLTIQFAQFVADAGASSVLIGSSFEAHKKT